MPEPIVAKACDCDERDCEEFLQPEHCIHLIARSAKDKVVKTQRCPVCNADTWHKDGVCLRSKEHDNN